MVVSIYQLLSPWERPRKLNVFFKLSNNIDILILWWFPYKQHRDRLRVKQLFLYMVYICSGGGGCGGDSPINMTGVLVGNFEKNP